MVGVGLFYRKGYFDQRLTLDGWQEDSDDEYDVSATPLVPVAASNHQPWLTTVRDVRAAGPRTGLADDGGPGTDLSARHQPRRRITRMTGV